MNDLKPIKIILNGESVIAQDGETLLKVCQDRGIDIPTFCNDERLNPSGSCRMCIVEVNGSDTLLPSCATLVAENMTVNTDSPKVRMARKEILELLWTDHPNDCLICEKAGACKLQDYSYEYDIKVNAYYPAYTRETPNEASNKFYTLDKDKCIKCGLCVRVCAELQKTHAIDFIERGHEVEIGYPLDGKYESSNCVSCGNCVSVCPTGALMPKTKTKARTWEMSRVRTTCSYCGVGCQMELMVKDDKVLGVEPVRAAINEGLLCVKGKFAYQFINHQDRLKTPLIKEEGRFREASWEEALNLIVDKVNMTKKNHGSGAFAGLSSAKCTNEENYMMQKFMRAVIGTNNVDHCARLCHASTVAGLAAAFGSGAMTNSIPEVIGNDVAFVIGSNTTETHPVIGSMILRAKEKGAKLIVADPRQIDLSKYADVYLQIEPGTNVALINAMSNVIYHEGLFDKAYIDTRTEAFEDYVSCIEAYTPEIAALVCGVDAELIKKAARLYAKGDKAAIYYAMGVTQHSCGTDHVMSLSNLAMMCGNLGKESAGINPLRGQNNVQGACDLGALPDVYPGYQKVFDEAANQKFEAAWKCKLSKTPGLTVTQMFDGAISKEIRFMYLMGENPVVSDPDTAHVIKSLEAMDFLVVQDIFLTETAQYADVVLPAVSFAEKDGTFTNTERRVQRVRKAIRNRGHAKADWEILMMLMQKLGYDQKYESPEDIMKEINNLTPIYGGITYDKIDVKGVQWPCPTPEHEGTLFLHKDKFSRGKGKFFKLNHIGAMESPDEDYPLILTTGRSLYHFHTSTMTKRTQGINEIVGGNYLEMSEEMADKLGLENGQSVKVTSRRGSSQAKLKVVKTIKENVVFMPFHFENSANRLTNSLAIDKISKIPELKVSAVRVEALYEK